MSEAVAAAPVADNVAAPGAGAEEASDDAMKVSGGAGQEMGPSVVAMCSSHHIILSTIYRSLLVSAACPHEAL